MHHNTNIETTGAAYDGAIPFTVGARGAGRRPASLQKQAGRLHHNTKTVVFCWELGGGLGHLMQMRPLAQELVHRGHRVFVALRLLGPAERAFAGTGVFYLQAPCDPERGAAAAKPFPVTRSFPHVLANVGWGQARALGALASAWRNMFRMLRPDLVVCDHSPTALLASRGLPARRALIGSGFCCPPDVTPWAVYPPPPGMTPRDDDEPEALASDERRLLGRVNRVLESWSWGQTATRLSGSWTRY